MKNKFEDLGKKYNALPYGKEKLQVAKEQAEVRDKRRNLKKELKEYYMQNALIVKKHLQTTDTINKIKIEAISSLQKEQGKNIQNVLSGVIPNSQYSNKLMKIETIRGRENQSYSTIRLNKDSDIGVALHETMHNIEDQNPIMLANSLAFAKYRTGSEKSQTLKKLTGYNYKNEYAKPDKFFNPYCGKIYGVMKDYDTAYASEIMSMGIQELFTNPIEFAKKDREYFNFVIANLRGEL